MKEPTRSELKKSWKAFPRFRVLTMGVTINPPGAVFGPRTLDHYELIWVMEGEVNARFDKQIIRGKEGTVLFRKPGVQDYYEWSPNHRSVHAYIHFDLDKARRKKVSGPKVPAFRQMPAQDVLRPLFSYLLKLEERPEKVQTELMLPALDLMLDGYVSGELELKPPPASNLPEPVWKTIELIQKTMAQDPVPNLSLAQMASASGTTAEYLCRVLQKAVEVGPMEYAKLARLDKVAALLRGTDRSLKEIAYMTGFFDPFHLSKSFKKIYGLSPKNFRLASNKDWVSQRNPIIRILYCRFDPNLCPTPDEDRSEKKAARKKTLN